MGESEFGTCDICKKEANLERKYYRYAVKCECHSPEHFEIVRHCNTCIPLEPKETKILIKTSELSKNIA